MYKVLLMLLLISGVGIYQKTETPPVPPIPQNSQFENPQFETMDEYIDLLLEPATSTKYYTSKKPAHFERYKIDGKEKRIKVTLDGVSASVFVLRDRSWLSGTEAEIQAFDGIQPFYLEMVSSAPCWGNGEVICSIPQTFDWYGPFEGNLKNLLK